MTFDEILAHVLDLLQRQGRVSYRALNAARLQALAEPDTVVLSAVTYRLIQGLFTCHDLGAQPVNGIAMPVRVYRVMGESGAQSRLEVVSPLSLTPLVGRETEVALLRERWAQARDGLGQIVLLSGEAGIGKSRLVMALKEHVAGDAHTRWECRCSPYFRDSALYPVIDLAQRARRSGARLPTSCCRRFPPWTKPCCSRAYGSWWRRSSYTSGGCRRRPPTCSSMR